MKKVKFSLFYFEGQFGGEENSGSNGSNQSPKPKGWLRWILGILTAIAAIITISGFISTKQSKEYREEIVVEPSRDSLYQAEENTSE